MARRMYSESQLKKLIEETASKKLYQHNFVLSSGDYDDLSANSLQFSILSSNPEQLAGQSLADLSVRIAELVSADKGSSVELPAIGRTTVDTNATTFQLQILNSYSDWRIYSNSDNLTGELEEFFAVDYNQIYVSDSVIEVI